MDGNLYTDREGCTFVGCAAVVFMVLGVVIWEFAFFVARHAHLVWSWR